MAGIGDRGVALDHPFSAVRHGDVPVAEVASYVPGGGSEVCGDGLGGAFTAFGHHCFQQCWLRGGNASIAHR